MTRKPENPRKGPPPTRDEVEAETPGTKTDDERRTEYEHSRRGLKPDEETCSAGP